MKNENPNNNITMKNIYILLSLLLTIVATTTVQAQEATTSVTDDFSSYTTTTSGTTLGDNWVILPGTDGSYGAFGSSRDYVHYNEYDEHYVAGNSASNYTKGVWLVLKKQVSGTVTFTATNGNSSSAFTIYVSKAKESGESYEVTGNATSYSVPSRTSNAKTYTFEAGDEATYIAFCLVGSSKNPKLQSVTYTPYVDAGAIAKPKDFAVESTTYDSATFSWTAGGEETAWQMVYSTDADFDKDEATPIDITTNPYTLTGLSETTTYYAFLRAVNGEDVSSWTSVAEFTTPEQYPAPKDFRLSGFTYNSATLSWTAGSTETEWQIVCSTSADAMPDDAALKISTQENPYTITGLTTETTYYARIRANYGTGFSQWSEPIAFTPSSTMNLTVNDGAATDTKVPFYGYYVDGETGSQFIIPASKLAQMADRKMTTLTFHVQEQTVDLGNAQFSVYLKETDNTTFSSATLSWDDMEPCYTGKVSVTGNTMVVDLNSDVLYTGSNLLIGFKQVQAGSYKDITWIGETTGNNASAYYYKSSFITTNTSQFLPKVTITSIPKEELRAKMVVNAADPMAFGKITPESSNEAKQKTFTIQNTGNIPLTGISITASDESYVFGDYPTTIEPGTDPVTVTVTMDAATAGSHNAVMTIRADQQNDVVVNITGTYANAPATATLTIDGEAVGETVDFGITNRSKTKTVTVANSGDVTLHATISTTNATDFSLSDETLTVAPGEQGEFTVTFIYSSDSPDEEKTATITVSADGTDDVTFTATATPTLTFTEDFEDGIIPEGWQANGISVKKDNIGTYPLYNLESMAAVGNGGSEEKTLTTPLLTATEGDILTFDGFFYYSDEVMRVEYSTDKNTWNTLYSYEADTYENGATEQIEIAAPVSGTFYLRFTVNYFNGIDNISGFQIAKSDSHRAYVTGTDCPAEGKQGETYTATVTVTNSGTAAETLTARFFIGDTQYGSDTTEEIAAGATATFTVSFTPEEALQGDAFFTITNDNLNITTPAVAVSIEGEATGINGTTLFMGGKGDTYDISGRKLNDNSRLHRGIYVRNGKKYSVK